MRHSTDVAIVAILLVFVAFHVQFSASEHLLIGGPCSITLDMKSETCETGLEDVTFRDKTGTTLPIRAASQGEYIIGIPCQASFYVTAERPGYETKQLIVQPQASKQIHLRCVSSTLCANTTIIVNLASQCGWSLAGVTMTSPSATTPSSALSGGALTMSVCGLSSRISISHPNHVTYTADVFSTSTSVALACKACGSSPTVPNSAFVVIDTNTLQYTCNAGYQLSGMATVVCVDQSWSQAPSCSPIPACGKPSDTAHGRYTNPPDTLVGRSVEYTCDNPYTHASVSFSVCLLDLTWSQLPSCVIDCGPPPDVANAVRISQQSSQAGALAFYTCNGNYVLTGNQLVVCQANGDWTTPPTCVFGCGPAPTITGGTVRIPVSTVVGSTATYVCEAGLHFVGRDNVVCLTNGLWGPLPLPECVEYELMFRGISGITDPVYNAWITGTGTTTSTLCRTLADNSCNDHYRNPKADVWSTLGVSCVRFSVYSGTTEVAYAVFDATGSTIEDWFKPENLIETTWTDMFGQTSADFPVFSLLGDRGREFFAVQTYNGCAGDPSFVVVVVDNSVGCPWDNIGPYPRILYATGQSTGLPQSLAGMAVGDYVAISYKT